MVTGKGLRGLMSLERPNWLAHAFAAFSKLGFSSPASADVDSVMKLLW